MVASTRILGADGSPAISGGEPRRIPVVGGPLHGEKVVRKTEQPLMGIQVMPMDGSGDPIVSMLFEYRDTSWRFLGWGDQLGRMIAKDGTAECAMINADKAADIDSIRSMCGSEKTTSTPVQFEGMP